MAGKSNAINTTTYGVVMCKTCQKSGGKSKMTAYIKLFVAGMSTYYVRWYRCSDCVKTHGQPLSVTVPKDRQVYEDGDSAIPQSARAYDPVNGKCY